MTNQDYTAILFIIDRSGSMSLIRREAENSVNAFIESQRKLPGKCTVRIVDFDFEYSVVLPSTDIQESITYDLVPRGSTALHDAMGRGIVEFGEELASLTEDERPGRVVVVVMTDGLENASQDWTSKTVKKAVQVQKDQYDWDFLFLAANQDAVFTAEQFGIGRNSAMTFGTNPEGLESTSRTMDSYVSGTRSGLGYQITDEDRNKSMG